MARQFRSDDTSTWSDGYGSGADGALTISGNTTYDGARASCSGTSGGTALTLDAASTFANNDLVIIHQTRGTGVGIWELNKISSGGGGTSLTMAYTLQNTYTDSGASQAQIVELKQYTSVTVNASTTWSSPDWGGNTGGILAFCCSGTTTVTGTISTNGGAGSVVTTTNTGGSTVGGFNGGNARYHNDAPRIGHQGEGTSAAGGTQSGAANGNGGGGGEYTSNGNPAAGGSGGNGGAGQGGGQAPGATGGTGGGTAGVAALTTMVFGGGGGGGTGDTSLITNVGAGGSGGGIVLIITRTLTITGSIVSNGGAGGTGHVQADGSGGAGGSILLKGQIFTLGTNLITATGGAGGTDAGREGGTGRIHADYASTLSGSTNPTLDSRLDVTLGDRGGAFLFNMI